MNRKWLVALAVCGAVTAADVIPAQAQSRDGTVMVERDEQGRVRTRILLQRRSFLDGGTEVLPGQRKYTDYVNPPGQRPIDVLGPGRGYERQPLNGYFDVPQYRNF